MIYPLLYIVPTENMPGTGCSGIDCIPPTVAAIAAVVLLVLVVAAIVLGVLLCVWKRRRSKNQTL